MIVDTKGQYKTREGEDVIIYSTSGTHPFSVHGARLSKRAGGWLSETWKLNGSYTRTEEKCPLDLVEVVPEKWRAIIKDGDHFVVSYSHFPTKELAMKKPFAVDAWKEPE